MRKTRLPLDGSHKTGWSIHLISEFFQNNFSTLGRRFVAKRNVMNCWWDAGLRYDQISLARYIHFVRLVLALRLLPLDLVHMLSTYALEMKITQYLPLRRYSSSKCSAKSLPTNDLPRLIVEDRYFFLTQILRDLFDVFSVLARKREYNVE